MGVDEMITDLADAVWELPIAGSFAEVRDVEPDDEDAVVAAHVFHLPGQHDQATHGRGGAGNPTELAAAARLNDGKKLDTSDPTNAKIVGGIEKWTAGGNSIGQIKYEMTQAARDPDLDTEGATLMRTVAGAPANAPTLYRGMEGVAPDGVPVQGQVFKLGPTSFSRSRGQADDFAQPTGISSFGHNTSVKITLKKNSRSLQIDQHANIVMKREKEHISMGTFRVTSSRSREIDVKAKNGQRGKATLFELEIEQVPDSMEATVNTRETVILPPGW